MRLIEGSGITSALGSCSSFDSGFFLGMACMARVASERLAVCVVTPIFLRPDAVWLAY